MASSLLKNRKTVLVVLALFVVLTIGALQRQRSTITLNQPTTSYVSQQGRFSLSFSKPVYVTEITVPGYEVGSADGVVMHQVYFSLIPGDVETPQGLLVTYGMPMIDGKGGVCMDENGNAATTYETIAGQEVSICQLDRFQANYFKHPQDSIEYDIVTVGYLEPGEQELFEQAVRTSLTFH